MNSQIIILKILKNIQKLFDEIKGRIKLDDDELYHLKIKYMNTGQKLQQKEIIP